MYTKYESILKLPRPLLGLAGAGLVLGLWYGTDLSDPAAVALLVFLALSLAAPQMLQWLIKWRITPNQVTIIGVIVSLAALPFLTWGFLETGCLIILAGALMDVLDGHLARAGGQVSQRGGFLDSVLDRISDAAILVGLNLYFIGRRQPLWASLSLFALVGAFLVSYTRAKAERHLDKCEVGFMGERPDRMIALVAGGLIGYPEAGVVFVLVFAWLTTIRRVLYTWSRLDQTTEPE